MIHPEIQAVLDGAKQSCVIRGDCIGVIDQLPVADMIFADPPDNIGLKYDDQNDSVADIVYLKRLSMWVVQFSRKSCVSWFSVNSKWQFQIWSAGGLLGKEMRMFPWYFTFGQHRHTDCGNNYRPLFRIAPLDFEWNTDRIRIPSKRQKMGDKRADPRGRVPGDVWGGPEDVAGFCRIQGNNKERRKWHPTQHPEKLVERCILMSTNEGDLVYDPFAGTGTTLRVCQQLNRRCITVDLSETYCKKIAEENNVQMIAMD